jgi:bacterioferritin
MDIKALKTYYDGEYPEAKTLIGNKADIKLLAKAYSSCGSETTAVLQYIFQHYVADDKDIKEVLLGLSINEMKHHELLGEAIVALGGVPYYTNGNMSNYNTKCVYEGLNLVKMLEQDLVDEKAGVEYYEYVKTKLSSDGLKNLIDRIILDEMVHIDTLGKMLEYITIYKE